MGGHGAIEVAKTVIEVADVAWKAMECVEHFHHDEEPKAGAISDEQLDALRAENRRLRKSLEQNLKLLENLTESPSLLNDCPPDLYARLVTAVNSESYLKRIKALQQKSVDCNHFPFKVATEFDTGGVAENCSKSNGWCKQIGEGFGNLACWEAVLCPVHLGTCSSRVVQDPCCYKACCDGGTYNNQSAHEGNVRGYLATELYNILS
ncbi:hypothetical protein ACLB2K_015514 [Fragaria x ananassa]